MQRRQRDMQPLQRAWAVIALWFKSSDLLAGVPQKLLPQPFMQRMAQCSLVMRTSSVVWLNTSLQSHNAGPKWVRWSWKHYHPFSPPSQNSPIDNEGLCSPITEEEISTAISQMKNRKAPGLDCISSEVLKLGGEASVRWLSSIFTTIWMEETVPSDWEKQLLCQFTRRVVNPTATIIAGSHYWVFPARSSQKSSPTAWNHMWNFSYARTTVVSAKAVAVSTRCRHGEGKGVPSTPVRVLHWPS